MNFYQYNADFCYGVMEFWHQCYMIWLKAGKDYDEEILEKCK